jgi:prepilin-type N-terminal cleavage/methylation domain-containing protein
MRPGLASPKRAAAREGGFSLIELLIAVAIVLTITGAVFQLLNPARLTFQAQPELADLQQRLRVGVETLTQDLLMAGAGPDMGPASGPLAGFFAPVLPQGNDAITLIYVPVTAAQTTLRQAADASGWVELESPANCPPPKADEVCGFREDMRAILIDASGAWDPVTITGAANGSVSFASEGRLQADYGAGTSLAEAVTRTYYLDAAADTPQLMRVSGGASDLPVVDHVVGIEFEYVGDARPPLRPIPPAIGVTGPFGWPPGENCVVAVVGGVQVPRLPPLGAGADQVVLAEGTLTDGPWCPHAASGHRFDADLLRVRRVGVTLRVQAAAASLRGKGALFRRPGTSGGAERYIPDQEIHFDVSPRNLNLGR